MRSSFTFLRIRGIEIGANWSWLLVFAFIIFSLATGVFPAAVGGLSQSAYWSMALVAAVLFVVSLLLHELGHAVRAQKEGMRIDGITLWLLGGVARFSGEFPSAGAEFRIAIAGPLVTVVLIAAFAAIRLLLDSIGAPPAVLGIGDYLWQINSILLAFNMLPALPLDGGRVLRSSLWHRRGDYASATASAAGVARGFAGLMIGLGILSLLLPNLPLPGLWLVLIGFFLLQAARAEETYARFSSAMHDKRVRDLMTSRPETVDPERSIASFIDEVAHMRGHSTYPVVDGSGRFGGLVSLRLAARVPFDDRATRTVREVMVGSDEVPVLGPDDAIGRAALAMQGGPGRAVVMEDGRLVGILSMSDVARAIEIEQIRAPSGVLPTRRRRRRFGVVLAVVLVLGVAFLYSPPFVILAPGTAFDVTGDVHISGVKTYPVRGEYVLTSVSVEQPNVVGLIVALVQGRELTAIAAVTGNEDPEKYFKQQQKLFEESEKISAAAAAALAGYEVKLKGGDVRVAGLSPGSPASKVFREGDEISSVDGRRVRLAEDVVRIIRARPSGTTFSMRIRRDGRARSVHVRSQKGIVPGAPGIGAALATSGFDVSFPFKITFRKRDIGGPSAGLVYALAVYDLLNPADTAHGRIVATTGTMDVNGIVGPIGGVGEKAIAAKRHHADVFLVPEEEVDGARGAGIKIVGVSTLRDAINALTIAS